MKKIIHVLLIVLTAGTLWAAEGKPPVNFAIFGLSHDHASGFIPHTFKQNDAQLVGIIETNQDLIARYSRRFHLNTNLFYSSLEELLAHTNIQAVATFTSTMEHRRVVELCAPRGIHVMMEKPLAVNMEEARGIATAAQKGGIQIIINYETTWYPGNQLAYQMVHDQHLIGDLRKIVIHDGHRGPKEIGCSTNFLQWLTDPVLNGGGAMTDFGCYGADLMTWLMDGQVPSSVLAVTQQIKPETYPKVEDEATLILTYPKAQGIIQASWNWPFNRKDMEIYGRTGYVWVPKPDQLRVCLGTEKRLRPGTEVETSQTAPALPQSQADPLSYLVAVVRGEQRPSGLSSLPINMTVVQILDAARESAKTGKRVDLTQP